MAIPISMTRARTVSAMRSGRLQGSMWRLPSATIRAAWEDRRAKLILPSTLERFEVSSRGYVQVVIGIMSGSGAMTTRGRSPLVAVKTYSVRPHRVHTTASNADRGCKVVQARAACSACPSSCSAWQRDRVRFP